MLFNSPEFLLLFLPFVLVGYYAFRHRRREMAAMKFLVVCDSDIAGARSSRELVEHICAHGYDALEYSGATFLPHQVRDRYIYSNIFFVPR